LQEIARGDAHEAGQDVISSGRLCARLRRIVRAPLRRRSIGWQHRPLAVDCAAEGRIIVTRKLGASLVGVLFLSLGCGASEAAKKMEEWADKVCACKDMDCIQKVQKEQEEWISKNGQAHAGASEADAKKVEAATKKMTDCVTKIATGAAK
jgi:hypothetical protein